MKAPTIPIPFHKLLKVAAVVDAENPQIQQLLDRIRAENFKVEISRALSATFLRMLRLAHISQ